MKKISGWARSRSRRRESGDKTLKSKSSSENVSTNGKAVAPKDAPPVPQLPQEYRPGKTLPENNVRPGSSNRMKPMLVGVSRASDSYSRPGTAGSLQNAVTTAADKVSQSPTAEFRPRHTRANSSGPRHVDIFSIANPKTSMASYNEEVAERNLDANVVAAAVPGATYVPSSKYQEEVAARNAAPPLRSSMDQVRLHSSEGYKPDYTRLKAQGAAKEHEVEGPLANDRDIRKFHEAERDAHYEYRRRRELLSQPTQPTQQKQAESARPGSRDADQMFYALQNGLAPQARPSSRVFATKQSAKNVSNVSSIPDPHHRHDPYLEAHLGKRDAASPDSLPGYQISRSELPQPREAEAILMSQQSITSTMPATERAPSALSTSSSVKRAINLPRRTIMDLTGEDDDVFSGDHGVLEKRSSTKQASQASYRDMQASARGSAEQSKSQSELMRANNSDTAQKHHQMCADDLTRFPDSTSDFSAVSAIASISPRSYQHRRQPGGLDLASQAVQQETKKQPASNLYTLAEIESELERSLTLRKHQDFASGQLGKEHHSTAPMTQKHDFATGSIGPHRSKELPPSPELHSRTPTQSDHVQSTPSKIQLSPESLHSADFINPSTSFGVRTRDFALTPNRVMQTQPTIPASVLETPKAAPLRYPQLRVKEPNATSSAAPDLRDGIADQSASQYSSGFNENAFKQKQEAARMALIKLQQSLNEDFATPPPRATSRDQNFSKATRRQSKSSSSSDGRPYAPPPTSMHSSEVATAQVNGSSESRETSRARSILSIHEQVTHPYMPSSRPVRRHISPNPETRKPNYKGKQRELSSNLSEMQRLTREMSHPRLAMPTLSQQRIYEEAIAPAPRSPGEVSLSSFPQAPASRRIPSMSNGVPGPSHHHNTSTYSSYSRGAAPSPVISAVPDSPGPRRSVSRKGSMRSTTSAMSSASQHGIPYHLIPDRGSSMRDSLVAEDESES